MKTFEVQLNNGIIISSKLHEDEVAVIQDVKKCDIGNGYVWYNLPVTELNGKQILFSLCFYNGEMDNLSMTISNPEFYSNSWDDWSEEEEKACAKDTEKWLNDLGYHVGKYSWGEIWAGYDSVGCEGGAKIRYVL